MSNDYKIVALLGESGTGKDTLMKYISNVEILQSNYHMIKPCTTRPPRIYQGHIEADYHFMTMEQFSEVALNGQFLEMSFFNHWGYGTPYDSLSVEKVNWGIFNSESIFQVIDNIDADSLYIVRLSTDPKERMLRVLHRTAEVDVDHTVQRWLEESEKFKRCDNCIKYDYTFSTDTDLNFHTVSPLLQAVNLYFGLFAESN